MFLCGLKRVGFFGWTATLNIFSLLLIWLLLHTFINSQSTDDFSIHNINATIQSNNYPTNLHLSLWGSHSWVQSGSGSGPGPDYGLDQPGPSAAPEPQPGHYVSWEDSLDKWLKQDTKQLESRIWIESGELMWRCSLLSSRVTNNSIHSDKKWRDYFKLPSAKVGNNKTISKNCFLWTRETKTIDVPDTLVPPVGTLWEVYPPH